MNAGGHGSDTAHVLLGCRVVDLRTGVTSDVPATDLAYAYRHSRISRSEVVVAGTFGLQAGDPERSLAEIAEIVRWRREHQPGGSNAGSVFTNPAGDSAGRLIEEAGLKGHRIGSAEVSPKHANFIQADAGGSAADVRRLIEDVRQRVPRAVRGGPGHRSADDRVRARRRRSAPVVTPPPRDRETRGRKAGSGIDPRIRQRRVAVARHRGRRRLRIVVAVVIVVVLVAGGIRPLAHRVLLGQEGGGHREPPPYPDGDDPGRGRAGRSPPLISVNPGAVAAKVERLPWIATARVSRNWPDHITIAVTERVPVASMAGPGTSWSEVDRTGRTVQVDAARVPALVDVAVRDAKGGVPPAPLGSITNSAALPALRVARTLPPAFSGQVTQVIGNADGTVDLALNSGLTVLLGTDKALHAKYEAVAAIIAGAPLHGAKTIDVTVPQSPTVSSS